MTACGTGEGFGAVTWWGFSPAMDFQEKGLTASMKALSSKEDNVPELNILMVGAGDSRHLLTTIARAHRWPRRKINFYIMENNLELMGRHLLFLTVALEPPGQMGLQEKSELLLELFGNSLIRSQTAAYLQDKANLFIRYVTDLDFLHKQLPMINMSGLKFKEKDQLEAIFKFWRNPDPKVFQITRMWDLRNRQYLGNRYDSKQGAYDWDLHMKLYDRGARVINNRQYYQWREKGLAFEVREGLYDVSNKSLASGLLLNYKGEKVPTRGYWGDIVTSPYIAFGIETEEQSLLKTANDIHIKTAQDISQYNITALLHELVAKERYALPQPTEQATLSEITEEEEEGQTENDSSNKKDELTHTSQQPGIVLEEGLVKQNNEMDNSGSGGGSCTADNDYLPLPDVKIHFLPVSCVTELYKKSIYNNRFNVIYFSCSMVNQLTPELEQISAPQATLIVELTKFMLDLRMELITKFSSRVAEMAKEAGFVPFGNVDDEKDSFARFELKNDP
ncbi:dynein assembly factor 3, axonemal-like isoform X1 [Scyliorhinus canicula]|uniref:dynein assembly factor 3, axonemal-like isoform X1 n=2 Tax=Scyliorhinus canicula TaxID=7830 RepID=UPI0018F7AB19|nr:dynein assembly factor 3, axonemal-like isoform X1 [Scyliorhinus canicula]XP_038639836.1 dynein assembly factor 3, axonemal-like isoform X1 [Scyliorhinus canicula]